MKIKPLVVFALSVLLSVAASAAEFSADTIMVMPGGTETGKVYFKPPNISRTESMGMILITRHPLVYHLFTDTKKYVVTNVEEAAEQSPMAGATDFMEWVEKNNLRKVGSETVEGYKCDVYEGEVSFTEGQPPALMKFWYSEKLAYPVKNESTLPPPMGKISNRLENIELGRQPDHLFEIPAGYTREKNMSAAMGMGGFQPPSSGQSGKAPSPEEMEEMMKGMQEMMKQMKKQ